MNQEMKEKLEKLAQRDNFLMRVMKISQLSHIIAKTNRGDLVLQFPYEGKAEDYRFVLDAVPFSDEDNNKIMELLGGIILNTLD